jgi:hypothetical protein
MTAAAASRTDSERAVVRATIAVKKFYDRVEGERMWEGLKLERHVKVSVPGSYPARGSYQRGASGQRDDCHELNRCQRRR